MWLISSLVMRYGYILMSQGIRFKTRYGLTNTRKGHIQKGHVCHFLYKSMFCFTINVPKSQSVNGKYWKKHVEILQQTKTSDGSVWCPTVARQYFLSQGGHCAWLSKAGKSGWAFSTFGPVEILCQPYSSVSTESIKMTIKMHLKIRPTENVHKNC